MKSLTIEPTEAFYELDGVLCRVWKGQLPSGGQFFMFVALVALPADGVPQDVDAELLELVRTPQGAGAQEVTGVLTIGTGTISVNAPKGPAS